MKILYDLIDVHQTLIASYLLRDRESHLVFWSDLTQVFTWEIAGQKCFCCFKQSFE